MTIGWIVTDEGLRWMERGMQPEDFIGMVSMMLDPEAGGTAAEQLDRGYQHGGGWKPQTGFTMDPAHNLLYPGDPKLKPLAWAEFGDKEIVFCYPHAYFAVMQSATGEFEAARMD